MDNNALDPVLDEFFPAMEAVDTQAMAILHFLKDKGMLTDEEFAPYLEEAGKTSNIRWFSTRFWPAMSLTLTKTINCASNVSAC